MLDRRTLLTATSAAAVAAVAQPVAAQMDPTQIVKIDPTNMSESFRKLHNVRFPKQGTEGLLDFAGGFKAGLQEYASDSPARARRERFLKANGFPTGETELTHEECHNILMHDSAYAAEIRLSRAIQHQMWRDAQDVFYADRDYYLAEMEKTDKTGPGTLELNPTMEIPEYTTYEIHSQPGGYVGDPFAGWLYHYALALAFYEGLSGKEERYDQRHTALAQHCALPADGKVKRVLEIGCSDGRTSIALKEHFPDAEIWGIDIGAPMVRYAHHRAARMGRDVNFAQRLAEDTKFPDNHFDIVIDHLLFHEVTGVAAGKIIPEMHRVLRKGGVWDHNDGPTMGHPKAAPPNTIVGKAAIFVNHRWNVEPWTIQYSMLDFPGLLKKAGFTVDLSVPKVNAVKA